MRLASFTVALSLLFAVMGLAVTPAKRKAPAKKAATAKKPVSSSTKTKTSRVASSRSRSRRPATTWRNRQLSPTPDRYREIQQALAEKGYLKSDPSGVWDANSQDAMTRFQTDQKLPPTGRISAASLIGLGLGAKSAGAPEAQPAAGPSSKTAAP
jgi:hypothetical protein